MKARLRRILRLMWEQDSELFGSRVIVHVSVPAGEWLGTQVDIYWHKGSRFLGRQNRRDFWLLSEKVFGQYRGRRMLMAEELAQYPGLKVHRKVGG